MSVLDKLIGISGERSSKGIDYLIPVFLQHQKVYTFVQKYVKGKSVLDLGCGSGFGTNRLAQTAKTVVGIDIDQASIKLAKAKFRKHNLTFKKLDILHNNLRSKFDVIVSFQVIEHIDDALKYLSVILSHLKPQGLVIITTPNRLTQSYNENPYHVREYSRRELNDLLSEFFKVKMLELYGNEILQKYEKIRRDKIQKIFSLDILNLRRLIPKSIKIVFFSLFAFLVRGNMAIPGITEKSYLISKHNSKSIDLIAICQKK